MSSEDEEMQAIINECVDDTIDCCAEACIKLGRTFVDPKQRNACIECAALLRTLKKRPANDTKSLHFPDSV